MSTPVNRIEGRPDNAPAVSQPPTPAFDRPRLAQIKKDLLAVSSLAPQARGYAFEKFLEANSLLGRLHHLRAKLDASAGNQKRSRYDSNGPVSGAIGGLSPWRDTRFEKV